MFVYCEKCKYDSGDRSDPDLLARKIREDGGEYRVERDKAGRILGIYIRCPQGHDGDEVHLD